MGRCLLYAHEFNEVIANTAFEGGLRGIEFSIISLEYRIDASFAKCWILKNEKQIAELEMENEILKKLPPNSQAIDRRNRYLHQKP